MRLAENIYKFRKELGMSRQELTEKIGFASPQSIVNYEKSLAEPSIQTLIKLCEIFNVTIDELIGKEN